jgi:hypothetical protein
MASSSKPIIYKSSNSISGKGIIAIVEYILRLLFVFIVFCTARRGKREPPGKQEDRGEPGAAEVAGL